MHARKARSNEATPRLGNSHRSPRRSPGLDPNDAEHLRAYTACQSEQEEVRWILLAVQDRDVLRYADELATDRDRASLRAALVATNDRSVRARDQACEQFANVLRHPIETWDSMIAADPRLATNALMKRIIEEAERIRR